MSDIKIVDIEVFPNCFTLSSVDLHDDSAEQFVVHESRDDREALLDYLARPRLKMIGFNNIGFDYPVLDPLFKKVKAYWMRMSIGDFTRMLKDKAQEIIDEQENRFKPRRWINPVIPQRDIYLIWHFDNIAKKCSLKWVQCAIRWPSVEEMPFHHTHYVTADEIDSVLRYNLNDCLSTKAFYLKSKSHIEMRYALGEKFGLNLLNANDAKIGEKILLNRIADKLHMDPYELSKLRTKREYIKASDCLLPYIKFDSPELQKIHNTYKGLTITKTKGDMEFKTIYDGVHYNFGLGGLHAARKGVLLFDQDSADVSSYYPNLGIKNGWFPEHIGPIFCEVYEEIYFERLKYPKGSYENTGLKLALNGSYGKSNSEYSFLYDPKYTMQITLNGQLLLAMLCEWITRRKAGKVIMANTDGLEVEVYNHRLYEEACQQWQEMTKLDLEFAKYKLLAVRDVNNYFAINYNGKTKEKGAYEIDKEIHKDHSMRIVSLAVREAFMKDTLARDFIMNYPDLWDFFLYNRSKTGYMEWHTVTNGEYSSWELPKTVRYYISKRGGSIMLQTEKKKSRLHSGVNMTIANKVDDQVLEEMRRNLNRDFYVEEAHKLLFKVHGTQNKKNQSILFS